MKKLNKQAIIRQAERALKRTEEYQTNQQLGDDLNYKLVHIMIKEDSMDLKTVKAFALSGEYFMEFRPYQEKDTELLPSCMLGANYMLYDLEHGYKIVDMSLDTHWLIWNELGYDGLEHINCFKALQKYLKYCKQHGITKTKLQRETDYDGYDIMKYYQKEKHNSEPER